jgi:hypothetical protein
VPGSAPDTNSATPNTPPRRRRVDWPVVTNSSQEITEADQELHQLVHQAAPALLALPGVGPEVAGQVLISAGDNFDRIKSEAAFVHLCGAAPIPPAADAPTDTGSIAVVTVAPTMRSTLSFSAGSGTTHAHAPTPSAALTKVLAALGLLAIGMVITRGSNLPTIIGGLGVLTFAFFVVHSLATGGTVARAHSVGLGVVRASSGYLVSYYVGGAVLGVVATHIWSVKGWPAVVVVLLSVIAVAAVAAGRILVSQRRARPAGGNS